VRFDSQQQARRFADVFPPWVETGNGDAQRHRRCHVR
jgi:hypothetical protein